MNFKRKTIDFSYQGDSSSENDDEAPAPNTLAVSPLLRRPLKPHSRFLYSAAPTEQQKRSSSHLLTESLYVHCNPHSTQLSSAFTLSVEEMANQMVDQELLDDDESDSYDNGDDDAIHEVTNHQPIILSQPSTRHQTPKLSLGTNSETSAIIAELMAASNPLDHPGSPNLIDHGLRNRLRRRVLCDEIIDLAASFWAQNVHSLSIQHRLVEFDRFFRAPT